MFFDDNIVCGNFSNQVFFLSSITGRCGQSVFGEKDRASLMSLFLCVCFACTRKGGFPAVAGGVSKHFLAVVSLRVL